MAPTSQQPNGSTASKPGDRPRAQIAFEGEDEFSAMSQDPERRKRPAVDLKPLEPGASKAVKIDDLKPKKGSLFGFIKAIFDK